MGDKNRRPSSFTPLLTTALLPRVLAEAIKTSTKRILGAVMALDRAQAMQQALTSLVMHYSDAIELLPCDSLPANAYGLDPDRWFVFIVKHLEGPLFLGSDDYVAVHAETGEVRTLGRLGD